MFPCQLSPFGQADRLLRYRCRVVPFYFQLHPIRAHPVVALDETHAVGADLLLGNVVLVASGAAVLVVGRVLLGLSAAQGFGTLVDVE